MAPYPYMLSKYVFFWIFPNLWNRPWQLTLYILHSSFHRTLDPIFSIFVGVVSYYSYEARVQRPEGHSLNELLVKKYHKVFSSEETDTK